MKRGCNIHHSSLRSYFFIYMLNLGIKKQEDGGRNGLPCVFVLHMHRQLCAENKERKRDRGRGIDFLFDSILYHSLSERRSMTPKQINDWCISFFWQDITPTLQSPRYQLQNDMMVFVLTSELI